MEQAGLVAEALDRNSVQLKSLVTDFNTTARALAVNDTELEQAIKELPRTLRVGRPALAALNDELPAAAALRHGPPTRHAVVEARVGRVHPAGT